MSALRQVFAEIKLDAGGRGIFEFTDEVEREIKNSGLKDGLCTLQIKHTSASLLIQENADPSARADLEEAFRRLAPENAPHYTHTAEGPDDMPSHIRAALTHSSETIPIADGRLALGTWQGLYLFEHRKHAAGRRIVVTITGDSD